MPEPSLSELTNIHTDADLGTGAPAVILDNRDLVHTLNQNAQFRAENDWRRYTDFQNKLKGVFQDANAIADIETMDQDKPELKKRLGEALGKIEKNPHAFFSGNGAEFAQINGDLAKLRADSISSKQNNVYDMANRAYITRDPSLNTDENKRMIEGFSKQPLGKRQAYLLNLPGVFDPATIGKQINELTKKVQPYTKFSADNKFIESGSETSYDEKKWNSIAESLYNMQDDRGNLLRNTIQQRFNQLPKDVQEQYNKEADPAKSFYMTTLEPFRLQNQTTEKTFKDNPYELQQQKAKDKLNEMKVKHGNDVQLEYLKIGGRKEVEKLKEHLKGQTKNQQFGYLNRLVNNQVNSAIANQNKMVTDPLGGPIPKFEMDVSTPVLHTFGYTTGSGIQKETTDADTMYTDADGKKITVVFYKRNKDNKIVKEDGEPVIDKEKTKEFSKEEYKGIVGKELLGVSGSLKSVNSPDGEDDEDDDDNSGGPVPAAAPVKPTGFKQKIKGF